jgi:isopenicillin-N epimerase
MRLPILHDQFLLNPDITYLNFGSFGACPKPIFETYQHFQRELEFEPVQFITAKGLEYLDASKEALGKYINVDPDNLIFAVNPSYGTNIVAKSFPLSAGDEILSTNLEYGACDRTWNYYCNKADARYVRQPITLPIVSKEQFIEDFFKGLSPRTKAVFISHITSATALRLPVEEICAIAKERGLITFVDGAHVPGHIPLDLSKLQADIYTGAAHKWMMTPKGCSFLYVKKEFQAMLDPLVVSWGYGNPSFAHSQFQDYHQQQGTRDFSAFLTVPRAIQFMEEHHWPEIAKICRALVQKNVDRFCTLLGTDPISPVNDTFLGQMASLPIQTSEPEKLKAHLFNTYKIEVPVMGQDGRMFIRYSINAFNKEEDLDRLYDALKETATRTSLWKPA